MNEEKYKEILDNIDQIIADLGEEEKFDADISVVLDTAEQLREDLVFHQTADH